MDVAPGIKHHAVKLYRGRAGESQSSIIPVTGLRWITSLSIQPVYTKKIWPWNSYKPILIILWNIKYLMRNIKRKLIHVFLDEFSDLSTFEKYPVKVEQRLAHFRHILEECLCANLILCSLRNFLACGIMLVAEKFKIFYVLNI